MNQVPDASFAVKVEVRRWSKAVRIGLADCPYCHRSDVCISRPRVCWERSQSSLCSDQCDAATVSVASIARSLLLLAPSFAVVEVKNPVQQAGTSQNGQQCSAQRGPTGKLVAKFSARVVW